MTKKLWSMKKRNTKTTKKVKDDKKNVEENKKIPVVEGVKRDKFKVVDNAEKEK